MKVQPLAICLVVMLGIVMGSIDWAAAQSTTDKPDPQSILAGIGPVSNIGVGTSGSNVPYGTATFSVGSDTYALIVGPDVKILDITNPDAPVVVGTHTDTVYTRGLYEADVFTMNDNTYALATSIVHDGIRILNITDPTRPSSIGSLSNSDPNTLLDGAASPAIFTSDGHTYAAVRAWANDAVQIINITDPSNPAPVSNIQDDGSTLFDNPGGLDIFEDGSNTYAIVTSFASGDRGVQILNITDPSNPTTAGSVSNFDLTLTYGTDTVQFNDYIYALVGTRYSSALVDVTDPSNPVYFPIVDGSRYITGDVDYALEMFEFGDRLYALVGHIHSTLMLLDLTDPANAIVVSELEDDANTMLANILTLSVVQIDGSMYAVVASDGDEGAQIVRLSTQAELPPSLASVTYGISNQTITMTFDRDLDIVN